MTEPADMIEIEPLVSPPDATVRVPGSKSLTNRAYVAAALAKGTSLITGALAADDTAAMVDCLTRLGATFQFEGERVMVLGAGGIAPGPVTLDARLSGTVSRFLLPVLGTGTGEYRLDGAAPLRARPMGPVLDAARALGAEVVEEGEPGHLPVVVRARGLRGGAVTVSAGLTSQFVSGLLLAAPMAAADVAIEVTGDVVSRPYLDLTVAVMAEFGVVVEQEGHHRFRVPASGYRPGRCLVEPDASAASYFFAAAAITGGRVRIEGLGLSSVQGDVAFVGLLERMGAVIERTEDAITVTGTGVLHGIDADMSDVSDTVQTLAAVAVFADGPTTIRGVGFIRNKETDRIGSVVTELRRCGIDADEQVEGLVIHPGMPTAATVETYDDHRMAMSFALLGLRVPGIRIADPDCVGKTFPGYWDALATLRGPVGSA